MRHLTPSYFLALLSMTMGVFAQDSLPPKMEGRWSNRSSGHSNSIEVEIQKMESATKAVVKIAFWPYCRTSESVAEFRDGDWFFVAKRCTSPGASEILLKLRKVEGKNRLEGLYGSGDGPSVFSEGRTAYLEWK